MFATCESQQPIPRPGLTQSECIHNAEASVYRFVPQIIKHFKTNSIFAQPLSRYDLHQVM